MTQSRSVLKNNECLFSLQMLQLPSLVKYNPITGFVREIGEGTICKIKSSCLKYIGIFLRERAFDESLMFMSLQWILGNVTIFCGDYNQQLPTMEGERKNRAN